ncbi:hypothetical protein E4U52_007636 [Claviceps spartinae]|nr:hypothetical protein E4U52_007636 [Claviceps spartinae]KAG6094993.1 hypothetical protein E4U30_002815 [Claviceps sp. LM220 group G6]KAG6097755.1 hypothetical protein E4U31_004994 [Claviceps sp. LM219 group G6]KAG6111802.1 hypothetical protein E4U14_002280 [Claviceps sp. LM454 group G7]
MDSTTQTQTPSQTQTQMPTSAPATAGTRRSVSIFLSRNTKTYNSKLIINMPFPQSSGWMPAYSSLQAQKRTGAVAERRTSMSDQYHKGGMFSQFFHNNFGRDAK